MQIDGEAWVMEVPCLVFVKKARSIAMLRAPKHSAHWTKAHRPTFWPVVTAANPIPPALASLNECRLLYEARGVVERLNRESARVRLTRVAPRQPRRRWCPPTPRRA